MQRFLQARSTASRCHRGSFAHEAVADAHGAPPAIAGNGPSVHWVGNTDRRCTTPMIRRSGMQTLRGVMRKRNGGSGFALSGRTRRAKMPAFGGNYHGDTQNETQRLAGWRSTIPPWPVPTSHTSVEARGEILRPTCDNERCRRHARSRRQPMVGGPPLRAPAHLSSDSGESSADSRRGFTADAVVSAQSAR